MSHFEPYQNPRQSCLEQWRDEITQMRSLSWPYHAIAKWLLDENQVSISTEAIRQFCKVRGIHKGSKSHTSPSTQQKKEKTTTAPAQADEEIFTFEPKPIDVHKR